MTDHSGKDPAVGSFPSTCTLLKVMGSDLSQVRKNISSTNNVVRSVCSVGIQKYLLDSNHLNFIFFLFFLMITLASRYFKSEHLMKVYR